MFGNPELIIHLSNRHPESVPCIELFWTVVHRVSGETTFWWEDIYCIIAQIWSIMSGNDDICHKNNKQGLGIKIFRRRFQRAISWRQNLHPLLPHLEC